MLFWIENEVYTMSENNIWVVGHKNPDTDSICAAITYSYLKNSEKSDESNKALYIPKRAGEINAETAFVLNYFKADEPELITDVGTQVRDINIRKTEGVSSHISMKKAWEMMKILKVVTLPVVSAKNKLEGLIVTGDIAKSYMDVYDNSILSIARTQYRNIMETLEGKIVKRMMLAISSVSLAMFLKQKLVKFLFTLKA